jgi:hypothetical protein
MASITITKHHSAYLERAGRRLSELAGRKVGKREVLQALIDTAMEDEATYDPETSEPIDPYRKKICQRDREARTASFDIEALFSVLRTIS